MRWNSESGGRFSMNKSLYLGNADEDLGLEEGSGTIPKQHSLAEQRSR